MLAFTLRWRRSLFFAAISRWRRRHFVASEFTVAIGIELEQGFGSVFQFLCGKFAVLIDVESLNNGWRPAHGFWRERIEFFFRWEHFFWSDLETISFEATC